MKKLTNAEKAEIHKQLEEAEKAKFKPYEDRIADLEKENAELKDKNKALEQYADLADAKVDEVKGNLAKAKELLKGIVDTPMYNQMGGEMYENEEYKELIAEAEQFLKETK